jgi:hypothetical protein
MSARCERRQYRLSPGRQGQGKPPASRGYLAGARDPVLDQLSIESL